MMENEQLVARILAGDDAADNMLALWQQNRRFITMLARKFQGYAELEDLEQEGYIGLCEAVRHYDADQGIPFINYAAFWIKQTMQRYIDNCCSVVRVPVGAKAEIRQYKKLASEYRKYYGREASDREMRALLGVGEGKLDQIKKTAQMGQIRSLSEPLGDEDDLTISDAVASDENIEEDVAQALDMEQMKRELWVAVDQLPAEQSDVIRRKYISRMSANAIGADMGVSVNHIRHIEGKAMRTLRMPGRSRKFRIYFDQYLSAASSRHVGVKSFHRTWTSEVEREVLGY